MWPRLLLRRSPNPSARCADLGPLWPKRAVSFCAARSVRRELSNTRMNFVVRFARVEIHPSARRHGVNDDEILHAVANPLAVDDLGEDPDRWLVIGPDRAGNLLEIVVLITGTSDEIIIPRHVHETEYRKLLQP